MSGNAPARGLIGLGLSAAAIAALIAEYCEQVGDAVCAEATHPKSNKPSKKPAPGATHCPCIRP
jgi:hypothetical protein